VCLDGTVIPSLSLTYSHLGPPYHTPRHPAAATSVVTLARLVSQVLKNGECDGIRRLPSSAVAYVDSALWPAWLRIALTEPVFLHFTTGARPASPARSLPLLLPPTCPQGTTGWSQRHFPHLTWKKWDHQVALGVCCKFIPLARQHTLTAPRFFFFLMQGFAWAIRGPKSNPLWTRNYTSWTRSSPTSAEPPALRH
jgi:hypothetical protein